MLFRLITLGTILLAVQVTVAEDLHKSVCQSHESTKEHSSGIVASDTKSVARDERLLELARKSAELQRLQAEVDQLRATIDVQHILVKFQVLEINLTELRDKSVDVSWYTNGRRSIQKELNESPTETTKTSIADKNSKELNDCLQFVEQLKRDNFARPICVNNLAIINGVPAFMNVGGKTLLPIGADSGKNISFCKIGTELHILGELTGEDRVRLQVGTKITAINDDQSSKVDVPLLNVKEWESTSELEFGQTAILPGMVLLQIRTREVDGVNVEELIEMGLVVVVTTEPIRLPKIRTASDDRTDRPQ
jgi:Flp pilus assembly secretin CpaC